MASERHRGALIVVEGLDKAGKSSQCQRLAANLSANGYDIRQMRFPDRTTPIGQQIDAYLRGSIHAEDHAIHLLFSANRWEAALSIKADIAAGTSVIVDRYYYSGIVYSAAKRNPQLTIDWARKCDEGLPRPDVCIFLDITEDEAAKRGGFGTEKYEKREMQEQVRALFEQVRSSGDGIDFCVIDGGGPFGEVENQVLQVAKKTIQTVSISQAPVRKVLPWIS